MVPYLRQQFRNYNQDDLLCRHNILKCNSNPDTLVKIAIEKGMNCIS